MTPSRRVVFGTAGHVDHGKSALVRALTGTDPDRLAEEKAREMTIDLGFAFLDLPGLDQPVAIVDVPGHEMFLRNMVAGATGIDAALFIIAADEGVRPQTIEHLEVLRQLRVPAGVIVLTKSDKASPERLTAASEEARALVAGTFLEGAPVLPVSARTGAGLDRLRTALAELAVRVPAKSAAGPFRLPIDRAFVMRGAGTVVTGTVISGTVRVGDHVSRLPEERRLRVRGLQVHGQPVTEVTAGQRAAINLAGIEKEEVERGEVLVTPGAFAPSRMLDVRLELAHDAPRALAPRTRVRVHHGTAEVMARAVLLEGEPLAPGRSALAQLRLESPLVAAAGDPLVVRSYSPMHVIGGGVVVEAHPPKRRAALGGDEIPSDERADARAAVLQVLLQAGDRGAAEADLQVRGGLSEEGLHDALDALEEEGQALRGKREQWFAAAPIEAMAERITAALTEYHRAQPLLTFASLNALLTLATPRPNQRECFRLALARLANSGVIEVAGERVRLASHQPRWEAPAAAAREALLVALRRAGLAAPDVADLAVAVRLAEGECRALLHAMADAGLVAPLTADIFLHPEVLAESRRKVVAFLKQHRTMSIAEARDLLGASRKYLLPFLEQLDHEGLTARQGDARLLTTRGAEAQ